MVVVASRGIMMLTPEAACSHGPSPGKWRRARARNRRPAGPQVKGYTTSVRAVELAGMILFAGLMAGLVLRLRPCLEGLAAWLLAVVLLAYVAADFVSGLFHWIADTWGTPETPVVGRVFVRPFREHHLDECAITRHDFIEVNGANCLISIPVAAGTHFIPFTTAQPRLALLAAYCGSFLFWIFTTNQFHKWAHMERPPRVARCLQRWRLILPPEHHQVHHVAPHDKYYCITAGWWNEPLQRLGLFPALERLVSTLTGMRAREDEENLIEGRAIRVVDGRGK
jgi:hypothetical protein